MLFTSVYRTFYSHASSAAFLQLYISFVKPFLEYAAPVWDPHHSTLIDKIEKVQRFALRMASKQWNSDYATLLAWSGLPTLQSRRRVLSLCFFAQSIHGVVHSTLPSLQLRSMDSRLRSFDVCTFEIPFASSLSYQSSFFPRAVKLWNQLPIETKLCQSFLTFKHHLHCIFFKSFCVLGEPRCISQRATWLPMHFLCKIVIYIYIYIKLPTVWKKKKDLK